MAAQSNTQSKIDDVTKRLADYQRELDTLELVGPPTTDFEAEEKAAYTRLVKRETLHRVSAALSAELAELKNKLAIEKEEERRVKEAKVRADVDKAKSQLSEAIWAAYECTKPLQDSCQELDKLAPAFHSHGRPIVDIAELLARMLEGLGTGKVTVDMGNVVTVARVK